MTRKSVTEEELGLAPTEEEMSAVADDDVSPADDVEEPAAAAPAVEQPEPASEAKKPAEEPKMVDVRALQEARAEAREARDRAAVMEQRWNDFLAAQRAPKDEPKPAAPAWDEDPVAAGKWTQDQLLELQRQQAETAAENAQRQAEQQHRNQMVAEAATEFQQVAQADPAVQQAYDAMLKSIQAEAAFYPGLTPQQRAQYVADTELQHISYARQNRIPIGDYVKGIAATRGWQPAPAAPAAAAPAQKPDLAAVAAAQQRHQSLSDAPGGDAPAPLDAKALAKMSDKDFKAWMSRKGNEAKFDEIMGG